MTPSLNQGSFIGGAIQSVLSQTYPNIEYIIMDADSIDETKAVVAQYSDRLVWVSEPDRGQSHAINKGWRLGNGEVLAWLCADDLLLPETVQTVVDTFRCHPQASFVFGGCEMLDRHGTSTAVIPACEPDTWKLIHGYDYVAQPAAFVARRAIEEVGFVDETLHFGMDWDLFIRLSILGPAVSIPTVLARAHVYPETKSSSGGFKRWRELAVIMRRHGKKRYPPGYFIYGAETLREAGRRRFRRLPDWMARVSTVPRRWVHSMLDWVHVRAMTKVTRGWFDDGWAAPTMTRRLAGSGQTLVLRGRLPCDYPELVGQRLTVTCDGAVLADRYLSLGSFSWDVPLPQRGSANGVEVEIAARRSFVPKRSGVNSDVRRLAFYLDEISLV